MTVVPRWEWRTFGEPGLPEVECDRVDEEASLYLLSTDGDASVKVRDGGLDVKHLLEVAEDGLERWVPVVKAPFPASADDVRHALEALGVSPPLERPAYELDQLVREVVTPLDALRVVSVHKSRGRFTAGGCSAERSVMRTPAGTTTSMAVEAEDPERVRAAVRELGLAGRPVTCVARGLKALEGMDAHRFAVVDVGTNSVKLHVAERAADGSWRTIADRAEVTRLGQGLSAERQLAPEAIDRTVDAIARLAAEARRHRVEAVAAVGTAGMRQARNAAALIGAAQLRAGVHVEVIPGEEEARLAAQAALAGLPVASGPFVVFDTGGGSSQFSSGRDGRVEDRFSVDVGAAVVTERHGLAGAVDRAVVEEAQEAIAAGLAAVRELPPPDTVVGMGGALTNLAAVELGLAEYDPDAVHGTVLRAAAIDRQIERYRTTDADGRRRIPGLQPARAEVILAGACIVRTVLSVLGRDELHVSDRGLRHGVIAERFALPRPSTVQTSPSLAVT